MKASKLSVIWILVFGCLSCQGQLFEALQKELFSAQKTTSIPILNPFIGDTKDNGNRSESGGMFIPPKPPSSEAPLLNSSTAETFGGNNSSESWKESPVQKLTVPDKLVPDSSMVKRNAEYDPSALWKPLSIRKTANSGVSFFPFSAVVNTSSNVDQKLNKMAYSQKSNVFGTPFLGFSISEKTQSNDQETTTNNDRMNSGEQSDGQTPNIRRTSLLESFRSNTTSNNGEITLMKEIENQTSIALGALLLDYITAKTNASTDQPSSMKMSPVQKSFSLQTSYQRLHLPDSTKGQVNGKIYETTAKKMLGKQNATMTGTILNTSAMKIAVNDDQSKTGKILAIKKRNIIVPSLPDSIATETTAKRQRTSKKMTTTKKLAIIESKLPDPSTIETIRNDNQSTSVKVLLIQMTTTTKTPLPNTTTGTGTNNQTTSREVPSTQNATITDSLFMNSFTTGTAIGSDKPTSAVKLPISGTPLPNLTATGTTAQINQTTSRKITTVQNATIIDLSLQNSSTAEITVSKGEVATEKSSILDVSPSLDSSTTETTINKSQTNSVKGFEVSNKSITVGTFLNSSTTKKIEDKLNSTNAFGNQKRDAVLTPSTTKTDQPVQSKSIQPLCSQETKPGEVTPTLCGKNNMSPACFDLRSQSVRKCVDNRTLLVFPLCIELHLLERFVVGCTEPRMNFCLPATSLKTLILCDGSAAKACLGNENNLQPCKTLRVKRQVPQVPQLDTDAYYASCGNCSINVSMNVNEESHEIPTIEIKSEPLKE